MGHRVKGKGLWCLIGVGDAYSRGPIWDAIGNRGDLPHSGDVCRTPSADLGKSGQGFAIMHSYQYGVKRR